MRYANSRTALASAIAKNSPFEATPNIGLPSSGLVRVKLLEQLPDVVHERAARLDDEQVLVLLTHAALPPVDRGRGEDVRAGREAALDEGAREGERGLPGRGRRQHDRVHICEERFRPR